MPYPFSIWARAHSSSHARAAEIHALCDKLDYLKAQMDACKRASSPEFTMLLRESTPVWEGIRRILRECNIDIYRTPPPSIPPEGPVTSPGGSM